MLQQLADAPIEVLVLTAGGTGRELHDLLNIDERYYAAGFLDDASTDTRVKGAIRDWRDFEKYRFISALGSYKKMAGRRRILSAIAIERFSSYCSPLALVYPSARLHPNSTVIFPFSVVAANAELAEHTFVYHHAVISHDAVVGPYSIVSNNVCISGNVRIGAESYIGANSTINEGITVGNQCIVASGATVIHDVPDGSVYIRPNHVLRNQYV